MQKLILTAAAAVVIAGSGGFYGGTLYGKHTSSNQPKFNGLSGNMRFDAGGGQRFGLNGQGGRQTGTNFIAGEVLSKDDSSITVKLRDGGSRIVFLSESTAVLKSTQGSKDDITVGANVMVTGTTGSDGNLTAQSVSLGNGPAGTVPTANP